jgi:hypothetical protein
MRNNRDDEELARPMGMATQPQGKEREAMTHQGPRNRRIGRIAVGLAVLSLGLGLVGAPMTWAQTPAFTATAHGSLETFRVEESPRDGAASIRLSAARGETESFQLVLTNRSAEALRDIRISVSGLTDVAATAFAAAAVHMPKPGRTGGAPAGHYFDLLRPVGGETIAPGQYRPYWIDLKVAATAAPGMRDGQVTVTTSAGTQVVPLRFQVRNFQLPTTPSLKLAFAFETSWMEAYYGKRLTREQIQAAQDVMLEHRLGPLPMWNAGPELFRDESRLKECLARGLNVLLLTCGGETDAQIEKSLDALEPKIALLRRLGALDRTYLFGYDEITMCAPERIPAMRKAYERFHQRHPEIRRINTSQPDPRLREFVDIFVVPTSQFLRPMAGEKEVWWYSVGADNLTNEPDFRIDFPAAAQRGFFVADWKAGVKGHLYWAVQREWPANKNLRDKSHPENEWRTGYENVFSKVWVEDNGGGNLFYPTPAGSMWPTPRVKRIRDGVEDYEYLAQLQAAAAELARRKPSGGEKPLALARQWLTVPDTLAWVGAGWREGWNVTEGNETACTITTHPRAIHGGRQALRILPDSSGVVVTQDLPAGSGKAGVFSGWLKTDDLTGEACLVAEYRDAQGRVIQSVRSEPATGSTGKFVRRQLAVPPAPPAATTLRLGLSARAKTVSSEPKAPMQKAFFDDLSLQVGEAETPMVNLGFEAERLRLNLAPTALLAYRERVAECLEQCMQALR